MRSDRSAKTLESDAGVLGPDESDVCSVFLRFDAGSEAGVWAFGGAVFAFVARCMNCHLSISVCLELLQRWLVICTFMVSSREDICLGGALGLGVARSAILLTYASRLCCELLQKRQ